MGSKGNKTSKTKLKTDSTSLINKQPDTRFPYGVKPCIFFSRGMICIQNRLFYSIFKFISYIGTTMKILYE